MKKRAMIEKALKPIEQKQGELYRKYGITSYKQLPAQRFDEAMIFLTEWYNSLTGEEPF